MALLGYSTDDLPKFHYWLFGTITGFTGVLATLVVFVMYVFAQQYARRATFRGFWLTHHLYIILYILMFMHGAGRLVQVRQARSAALSHCRIYEYSKSVLICQIDLDINTSIQS